MTKIPAPAATITKRRATAIRHMSKVSRAGRKRRTTKLVRKNRDRVETNLLLHCCEHHGGDVCRGPPKMVPQHSADSLLEYESVVEDLDWVVAQLSVLDEENDQVSV